MRKVLLALILSGTASAASALPAGNSPFCIKGCDFGAGLGDCSFSSYQQCQATASGRDAYCDANPYYSAKAEFPPDRGRLSRRRY